MTLPEFTDIFVKLAIQLSDHGADEPKIRAYFDALKDLEPEYVAMAAKEMAQSGGSSDVDNRHWFPKSSEWRSTAIRIQRTRIADLQAALKRLPQPLCAACSDTGWEPVGEGVQRCSCASLRRLEALGRRPMPELPPASPGPSVEEQITRIADTLASTKGIK